MTDYTNGSSTVTDYTNEMLSGYWIYDRLWITDKYWIEELSNLTDYTN